MKNPNPFIARARVNHELLSLTYWINRLPPAEASDCALEAFHDVCCAISELYCALDFHKGDDDDGGGDRSAAAPPNATQFRRPSHTAE